MPLEEDIILAYQDYYTHSPANIRRSSFKQHLSYYLKMGYTAARYGYDIPGVNRLQKSVASIALLFAAGHLQYDYNLMHLPAHLKGKLLEIGFGDAKALKNMASLGWEAYGVDFDPIAVENALKAGLKVQQGNLEEQGYSGQFFNAVTMSHVIEHVPDPQAILKECYRILKQGGVFVAITPNVDSLGHRIFKSAWSELEPPRHLHIFTPRALKRLALEAGFTEVTIKTSRRDIYYTYLRSMSIRRTGRAHMREYHNPPAEKVFALGARLVELLQAKVTTQYGGEMILIARK
jgi:2-polyprenyl-3-methyl-5-hydroxy-6-metoxy-1,4-benzoquinol methylase